ncbi:acyltransferase domain-containing protein, partial [Inquilinus limosus]|uniref:acyltransferase domain-containing protein n=1 Tax=Inquilinus limosus TaxID=171674 RepID=UPI00126A7074
ARLAPGTAAEVQRAILDRDPGRARHDPGQLAHFVVLHSLARTWIRLGVTPDIVIGHSLGEHAAAVIAGVMSLDDGLRAVEARGRLFETLRPHGAMLAVAAGAEWLETVFRFGTELFVAAINGPEQTVLSGTAAAVAEAERALLERGIRVSRVPTYDTPGHSPLLAPILAPFRDALAPIRLQPPGIEMISTVTGRRAGDEIATAGYWVDMVERPVRFRQALDTIARDGVTFLEVGPGKALSNLAKAASGDWIRAISSLCDGPGGDEDPEPDGLAHACARLYCAGHSPEWSRLYGTPPSPVEAPTTAFDLKHIELPAVELQSRGDHPQPVRTAPDHGKETDAAAASVTAPAADTLAAVIDIVRPVLGDAADGDADAALVTLGLDSLALTAIRGRLQQAFGRAVPMAWFAAGASLRSIAAFYSQDEPAGPAPVRAAPEPVETAVTPMRSTGRADHVLTLRDGHGLLVALIHPVGGDVLCYRKLAEAWPGDARILGIRHPEAETGDVRYRPLAELAALYRRAVLDAAGRVPDIVGGWSFGGAVAQEMAAQWEEEGTPITALLAIDSPLPDGAYARRLRRLVDGAGGGEDDGLLDRMIADPGFEAVFDEQHGLGRLRAIADADTVERVLRIHAANAAALAGYRPRPIRAPLSYALALRGGNARSSEEAAESLAILSSGPPRVLGIDGDHFSIMRSPAVEAVAGFLGAAARRTAPPVLLVAE